MPTIKAQAVMANSIAVTHYVSQPRMGKQSGVSCGVSHRIYFRRRHPEHRRASADGGILRESCQDRAATRKIPRLSFCSDLRLLECIKPEHDHNAGQRH